MKTGDHLVVADYGADTQYLREAALAAPRSMPSVVPLWVALKRSG